MASGGTAGSAAAGPGPPAGGPAVPARPEQRTPPRRPTPGMCTCLRGGGGCFRFPKFEGKEARKETRLVFVIFSVKIMSVGINAEIVVRAGKCLVQQLLIYVSFIIP